MSVCTNPPAESFGDVAHRCQMSRDERWAVLNRNTFQDILNSILTQTPAPTPLVFSAHEESSSLAEACLREFCGNPSGSNSDRERGELVEKSFYESTKARENTQIF